MVPAKDRWTSDPRIFVETCRVKNGGPIYAVGGPREPRVTIYAQQCRAINLVCALYEQDRSLTEKRIAVVGAGAAGMTAASTLRAIGLPCSRLTVYETAASPLYTQRDSYRRFLHPRLFHWPEAGWSDGLADLPAGGWDASYAATVRKRILCNCMDLRIEFCTKVSDVRDGPPGPCVSFSRLHDESTERAHFDVVLLATGFPVEQRVKHTLGGSYWHGVDGLADLRGDVHVVGDGDGALTEVLMMLIDRFGHAAVERLCEMLPLKHLDNLNTADLIAQGNPSAEANPDRKYVESPVIKTIFELLSARRSVFIHAAQPLSGKSFLLNRALVSHLVWTPAPMVTLRPGSKIHTSQAPSLGKNVIWRTGVGSAMGPAWAQKRLTPVSSIKLQKATFTEDKTLQTGLLVGLLDGLRRPMWTPLADARIRSRISSSKGWNEPAVGTLHPVGGRPTELAKDLMQALVAAKRDLELLGLDQPRIIRRDNADWVSIDTLARAGSLPHQDLVEPISPTHARQQRLRRFAARLPATPADSLRRDDHQRLWFRLPSNTDQNKPSRSAVCALVDPSSAAKWARDRRVGRKGPQPRDVDGAALEVDASILRGLSDVANTDVQVQLRLASIHQLRNEWDRTRDAYLRAARRPGGSRRSNHPSDAPAPMNEMFRRVLLRLASATARLLAREQGATEHAIWLLLSVAAADLVTLADRDRPIVDLRTTDTFLIREWAPRVRGVLTPPGKRSATLDYAPPPGWATDIARAGIELRPPSQPYVRSRTDTNASRHEVDTVRALATETARLVYAETPDDALLTLSEFGVWPAGTDRDLMLKRRLNTRDLS